MAYSGTVPTFDPNDDFTMYMGRFEQFCVANKVEDNKIKVALLLSHMDKDVYKTLHDLSYPDEPSKKKFDEVTALLKSHYSPVINTHIERREFYGTSQMGEETCGEWHARLKRLALNCSFGTSLDNVLRDRFISGMLPGPVLDRVVEEKVDSTSAEVLKTARAKELALTNSKNGNANAIHAIQNAHTKKTNNVQRHSNRNGGNTNNGNSNGNGDGATNRMKQCQRCGRSHGGVCRYNNYTCHLCGKKGHIQTACKSKSNRAVIASIQESGEGSINIEHLSEIEDQRGDISEKDEDTEVIYHVTSNKETPPIRLNIKINQKSIRVELDSGSPITAINGTIFNELMGNTPLDPTTRVFRGFTGEVIIPEGVAKNVEVTYKDKCQRLNIFVIKNATTCLVGRDFIHCFKIFDVSGINTVREEDIKGKLQRDFPDVCTEKTGCFKHAKITLHLKPNAIPRTTRPRPMPLALKDKVEKELLRMEQKGMIMKTVTAEWSTQIVPVVKGNGTVRVCGSYVYLNRNLEDIYYPLPRIDHIFASLAGNHRFSKIDLSDAYMQFELDEKSKDLVTISTHVGLYKMNRMPFGVKCSSFYFQKHIDNLLQGVLNVFTFQDDILIGHKQGGDYNQDIARVLTILGEAGLTVNVEKCKFFQEKLAYLGLELTKAGVNTNKNKIKAIVDAPTPKNLTELRSFLGAANYYSKFVTNMASKLKPLYDLLKKDTEFRWSEECQKSFNEIKSDISSDIVLTFFDPNLPIIVTSDASDSGIGATLAHKMLDGSERLVTCVSRTYTSAEKNYSIVHKESLACYYGVKKFEDYLYGQKFTLRTDQKALVTLFGSKKEINTTYANRIKRYALFLSNFDYEIQHIKGKDNVIADFLSRLPLNISEEEMEPQSDIFFANAYVPIDRDTIIKHYDDDPILKEVNQYVKTQWPFRNKVKQELMPYYNRRFEMDVNEGCLMLGDRIVIPSTLQNDAIQELHNTHIGIVKMKALARSYLWFPGIDKIIEKICKSCLACLKVRSEPPKQYISWPKSRSPFEIIHLDFFSFQSKEFFIIKDTYTKWIEVYIMRSITSAETIEKLRDSFARFGLPETVISDNGPSLVSELMEVFFTQNNIKHMTIAPYNPESNGSAESAVKVIKNKLMSAMIDEKNRRVCLSTILARILLIYRNTPHAASGKSPAEAMFNRKLKIRLDLMKRTKSVCLRPTFSCTKKFQIGDTVMIRDYRTINKKEWERGQIIEKLSNTMYLCKIKSNNVIWKRHVNQIRKCDRVEEIARRDESLPQPRGKIGINVQDATTPVDITRPINTDNNIPDNSPTDTTPVPTIIVVDVPTKNKAEKASTSVPLIESNQTVIENDSVTKPKRIGRKPQRLTDYYCENS